MSIIHSGRQCHAMNLIWIATQMWNVCFLESLLNCLHVFRPLAWVRCFSPCSHLSIFCVFIECPFQHFFHASPVSFQFSCLWIFVGNLGNSPQVRPVSLWLVCQDLDLHFHFFKLLPIGHLLIRLSIICILCYLLVHSSDLGHKHCFQIDLDILHDVKSKRNVFRVLTMKYFLLSLRS